MPSHQCSPKWLLALSAGTAALACGGGAPSPSSKETHTPVFAADEVPVGSAKADSYGDPVTFCVPGEDTFFSCATKNGKVLSLCGTLTTMDDQWLGWVQYRFGKPGRLEMRFPDLETAAIQDWQSGYNNEAHFRLNQGFGGAFSSYTLEFQNSNATYQVFENTYRDLGDGEPLPSEYGVRVRIDDKETVIRCGEVQGTLGKLVPMFPSSTIDDPSVP